MRPTKNLFASPKVTLPKAPTLEKPCPNDTKGKTPVRNTSLRFHSPASTKLIYSANKRIPSYPPTPSWQIAKPFGLQ